MLNFIVYILIIIILFFVSVIAAKAINRGIVAKKKLNNKYNFYDRYKNKKNNINKNYILKKLK